MSTTLKTITFCFCASCLPGCAFGLLYSDTREPLVVNMRTTPVGVKKAESGTQSVKLPLTSPDLSFTWNGRAIGDAAKRGGLSEIYYADLHTISILWGLWQQKTVEVYGR